MFLALAVSTAGCSGQTATLASPFCSFGLSPSSAPHAASGGMGSTTVVTPAGCSWTASSDVEWVTVTAGARGQGGGTVSYRVGPNTALSARNASIKVAGVNGQGVAVHRISQQGTTNPGPGLSVKGAYTFSIEADPSGTCGLPVTTFRWPVTVEVTSYRQGTTIGSIVFPPTRLAPNSWWISAGPTGTRLTPGQGSPGPAAAAYDVVVDGGRWEAAGPTRARDGRGEISGGTASGAGLALRLPGSDARWECGSDAEWSLLTRWIDRD